MNIKQTNYFEEGIKQFFRDRGINKEVTINTNPSYEGMTVTFKDLSIKVIIPKNEGVNIVLRDMQTLFDASRDNCEEYKKLKEYRESFKWLIGRIE